MGNYLVLKSWEITSFFRTLTTGKVTSPNPTGGTRIDPEEGSESKNKEVDGSNAGCDRVSVRVSSFWRNNAKLFFIQLEASFRLAGVTVEQTKFDYLVVALDPETLSHATDIVCEPPPHPYTALKSSLITQFEVSQNKKLKTLIEDLELGDRSPSVLLRQMRDLGESHVDEAFFKKTFG
ncbi:hypothetical protein AVEN_72771-1 [Araneus ventricosus]|uniref:DUF7041 domain-containing protein n=1 Tax=Araneus ventricosus TaxID=182803 RepID=A0A4Y2ULU8_ARAVE|nr:hypothetical protein AVEN_72771-1 [Araneus ventricosus]